MGEKGVFSNCVFERLCSSENTIFIVSSAQHSSCNKKMHVEKKTEIYENIVDWDEHGKKVFPVCFFSGFNVFFCVCVCCFFSCCCLLSFWEGLFFVSSGHLIWP